MPPDHFPPGREFLECDAPGCGKSNPPKRCSRCQTTYYCDAACQRKHWREGHRQDCREVGWMREQIAGIGASDPAVRSGGEGTAQARDAAAEQCCGICLDEPIADPFVLPGCGHAFCFGCLRRWQETSRRSVPKAPSSTGPVLSCPSCRAEAADAENYVIDRARLCAERANRRGLSEAERQHYRDLALAELDKALESNGDNLQALFSKVEVLQELGRPSEALETLEKMVAVDTQGRKNSDMVDDILEQVRIADEEGRVDEAERLLAQVEGMLQSGMSMSRMKGSDDSDDTALFDIYIKMGEAKEALKDWEGAKDVYIEKLLSKMTDPSIGTPPLQRMMWMGLSRCCYNLGDYAKAINAGQMAIEMNRHFPGVHKYVALSQKASGDLEAARKTMARAVNYETPWDEENKEKAMELYNELMAD